MKRIRYDNSSLIPFGQLLQSHSIQALNSSFGNKQYRQEKATAAVVGNYCAA